MCLNETEKTDGEHVRVPSKVKNKPTLLVSLSEPGGALRSIRRKGGQRDAEVCFFCDKCKCK